MPFEALRIELLEKATPIFFALIALEALVAWAMGKRIARWSDSLTSIATSIVMEVTGLFMNWLMLALFIAISLSVSIPALFGTAYLPADNPFSWDGGLSVHWLQLAYWLMVFVAVDFAFYWFHRSAHKVNLLWGSHVVHHSSEDYNLSVALRHSSIENLFSTLFYLPLAFFGVPWEMFLLCYVLNLFYMFWVHTELIHRLPSWFEFTFSTPSHHRVHHARDPKYIDRNFGGTFIIWDRLFGTFRTEEERPNYGITTPLQTYNPIVVNLHYYRDMARNVLKMKRLRDVWRYIWRAPGWFPASMGGPQSVPAVNPNHRKYNPQQKWYWLVYALAQFGGVMVASSLLFEYVKLPQAGIEYVVFWSVMILWSVTTIGGLLMRGEWAYGLEATRLVAALAISGHYLFSDEYALPAVAAIFASALASLIAWAVFRGLDRGWRLPVRVSG